MKVNLAFLFLFILSLAAASAVTDPDLEAREADAYEDGLYERDSTVKHLQRDHSCNQQEPRCASARKSATEQILTVSLVIGIGINATAGGNGVVTMTLTASHGTGIHVSARRSVIKQILIASPMTGIGTVVTVQTQVLDYTVMLQMYEASNI
ncbi:hypothetical protein ANOM_000429 [Aspergillus nomiae NRRL 13137]|uniref:Uncharacterized protein n=1 Tax=Aspergillus nomiae NRRL (strain ATCC 15546 / NRRL 13137 / CBS 260.88 / M93) TaxID=1509407 RepID=A0A0L1JI70_ASPN3|nr:uncharacterized protein ANOM_000429 [Aspergillus nomiae NRRL 13137]KNG91441.1 hypothetical protein ANOM_000429 [Aspergillus nomiae NRRL 13137]